MRKFYLKIILPTILSVLLFILTFFLIIIPRFQEDIMSKKREMIQELTNTAWSILSVYENDEKEGLLTRDEAQQTAKTRIQHLRYGEENKDYFWITDMTPVMIVHPFRSDLNGQDLRNFTDPHGKKLFVEFVQTVKKSEQGYVDYMWQWKDDSLHIVPKLSYVKLFKPWNWVIGTGIYIDDVKKDIARLTNRMIWISFGISILLGLLLIYILKQSIGIERKRIAVADDLHETKEKFRTLVEAATEGLLMLIDGKIAYSNDIICKMTGYDADELNNIPLNEIISKSNNRAIIEVFSKSTVKEGQFDLNLSCKNGSLLEVLITSSTAIFYGKTVNIIIVKDISTDKNVNFTSLEYQKIISTLNVGFFKTSMGSKGSFLFANETALRIFGYENFGEMMDIQFLKLVVETDDRKNLIRSLKKNGFTNKQVVKIQRKSGEFVIVAVSLVSIQSEDEDDLICDGLIEDITLQEKEKARTNQLIVKLKTNNLLLEHPIKEYVSEVNTIKTDATIDDAIRVMTKKKTDCLLLANNVNNCLGIITNTDIQTRILRLNLKPDNPAYLIMSSPIVSVYENNPVFEVMRICNENGINHLLVRNSLDEVSGIFNAKNVYNALIQSLSFYIHDISQSESIGQLKQQYNDLQLMLWPLIQSEVSIGYLTNITTPFADAAIRKIIELSIDDLGQPPVSFSFICLGSEGRKEETLFTDQDNAIIYEDVPKEKEIEVNAYFVTLGEKVCGALHEVGYAFCKGNIMAMNQQWCKPLSIWEKYFIRWISAPEPQHLLDASIFFDFRLVYGDERFAVRLREVISAGIGANSQFLYHMAQNAYNTRVQHVSGGNILSDKHAGVVDLKSAVAPIIMFARVYALQNHIIGTNTIDRLLTLKDRHLVSETTIDEILYVYSFLMKLRFRNQVELLESNLPLSNLISTKKMMEIEFQLFKKVLSIIPDFQNKIKTDFRISM
ncbi:MAG: PAS domain S-box protein [Bacteroidales bacterium]|nr:PAS domain S-box protein [Bacteroidales bacterium]